jgi:tetratricopeptide (TPR) repeat protein
MHVLIKNWSAALTLSVVLLAGAGIARAGDSNAEKARAHFQQGDTYFKLEKYANALQEFEQAYLAKQDPSFLYNIAQCHRLMGNRVEAVRFYKRYLNDAPSAANRPVAEKHIRDLESALGAEELTGAHPPPPPVSGSASAAGGSGPGMPLPQQTTSPPVALAAPPPPPASDTMLTSPPASPSDEHPFYTKWWFWTGAGAVVAGGLLLLLLTNGDPSCPAGRTCQ